MTFPDSLIQDPGYELHWQMTNCERCALQDLLRRLSPRLSVEVGTYLGGSLQVLSAFSERVISLDIDPEVERRLDGKFPNVEYRCGDSAVLLPDVIQELNDGAPGVGFILIDGDHSAAGVRGDIEAILKLQPRERVVMVMHDSFNPDCREGMRSAAWSSNPWVHWVELDFIPGVYHYEAYDTAAARTMWGGFACAVLEPAERSGDLEVGESQRGLFEAVLADSVHSDPPPRRQSGFVRGALSRLKRKLCGATT